MSEEIFFAKNLAEAKEKYEKFKEHDPFPKIVPALLNSADISDYVRYTGMIYPFYDDKVHLKPATYAISILGKMVYWDEKRNKKVINLNEKETFKLGSNSIAFVTLEPIIQLPYYIAARFNLKINNVYKGLLLGTGPIVDPGYCGKLSLPLHNLTNNDYYFKGGDRLIWMEFTKLSYNETWLKEEIKVDKKAKYYSYEQKSHNDWDVEDFLHDAFQGPIDSSLPNIKIRTDKSLKKIDRQVKFFNIGLLVTFMTILFGVVTLIRYFTSEFKSSRTELLQKIDTHENQLKNLQKQHIQDSIKIYDLEKVKSKTKN